MVVSVALTSSQALAAPALDEIAGVYKHRFANADVQGDKYTSEDILEIVPIAPSAAYFRVHLEFFNGHVCDLSGVANWRVDRLVYEGPKSVDGAPCQLTLAFSSGDVRIFEGENGACREQTCGARGGYGFNNHQDADFVAGERRPIQYMARLLASSEYREALTAYKAPSAAR